MCGRKSFKCGGIIMEKEKDISVLRPYVCIEERDGFNKQTIKNRIYWVDETSIFEDDDAKYGVVYRDAEMQTEIGVLNMARFRAYIDYLCYCDSISRYINSEDGILLKDVIVAYARACERNEYHPTLYKLMKYATEHNYNKPEYYNKEFLVKSISFQEAVQSGDVAKEIDYQEYLGYSLIPVTN
jgi:hypothetical protein